MINTLTEAFNSLDIYASPIGLNLKGAEVNKTTPGAFLSLITWVILTVFSLSLANEMRNFDRYDYIEYRNPFRNENLAYDEGRLQIMFSVYDGVA
jgi:hypothetical protein